MKSKFLLSKFLGLAFIFVLGVISIISCGGGGGSNPPPPPNLTGEWIGNFVSNENADSFEISFEISSQNGDSFGGTWISRSDVIINEGVVDGYVYPSDDGRWLVNLSLSWGSVTCCAPLFGCSDFPEELLDMLGYFENESIVDEEAFHDFGCIPGELGKLTVSRQPSQ